MLPTMAIAVGSMIVTWSLLLLMIREELSQQDYYRIMRFMIVTLVVGVGLIAIGFPEVLTIGGVFLGITVGLFGFLLTVRHPDESPL